MRKIPIYSHPAAGWPALVASTRKLMDYKAFLRGSISILHSNQPNGGFDCGAVHGQIIRPIKALMSVKRVLKSLLVKR